MTFSGIKIKGQPNINGRIKIIKGTAASINASVDGDKLPSLNTSRKTSVKGKVKD